MTEKPTVYTSNQTQHLETLLRDNLFFKSRPLFEKKLVFLPHPSLKNPLLTSFVADGKLDVALGVDFLELGSGVSLLYQWTTGKTLLFPPQDLLTLHLEALLDAPHLAPALALEFLKYGKYGGAFLKQWKSGWQKTLWDQVTQKWNYPYEILDIPLKKPATKAEIHLFNFPFLPKLYHLFFAKLSKFFSISYYQFSPCKEFWSDTVSEVEKVRLLEKNPQLSLYLDEGHPLLKNLGRLGRETFRVFEEEDFAFEEHYQAPEPKTFLTHLQNDLLHFQKTTAPKDSSVLLLPAASKLREVEILYAKLLKMECPPSEIQVFAPEISSYAPLIELVFGSEESPFDFTIRDLPEHPLLQAFLDLLTLNEERFTPASLFKIFSSPYFFALSEKEVKAFQKWIDQSGVKWGVSPVHREKLLPGFHDTTPHGTWEEAFKQLLNHLLYLPVKPSEWDLPYLDFTDSVLLGKC
ncbi:MAG: exodeoxyribonuclease V subunit gamma, partial [Chlamydiia bacterium]|nr:exodeoxyribonuclease V subunit gamma [Chlamydiia bacterium]